MTARYLTVAEVAERLRIGRTAAYALLKSGDLAHLRTPRGTIRVAENHLDEFVRRHTVGPTGRK